MQRRSQHRKVPEKDSASGTSNRPSADHAEKRMKPMMLTVLLGGGLLVVVTTLFAFFFPPLFFSSLSLSQAVYPPDH